MKTVVVAIKTVVMEMGCLILEKCPLIPCSILVSSPTFSQIFDSPGVQLFQNVANIEKKMDKRQIIPSVSADDLSACSIKSRFCG